MRVMVLVKATKSSEAGEMPSEQLMADMGTFNEALVKAGIMRTGDGLKPSSAGVRVRFSGKERMVTDGPFVETNELVAGYWLWEVASMDEAIEWVKRCPNPMPEDSEIEIRPFYEPEDFAKADPSGKLREREEALRDAISLQSAQVQSYLFFSGRCEEALSFYTEVLAAKVGMMMRFSECPDPLPEGMLQPGFENKIMHADFTVGKTNLMASDGCGESGSYEGFRLSLTVSTEADAARVFNALSEGGKIDMPLGKTFWSPCFGMVTDKFGIGWMVTIPDPANS
ncbi:YciI family protein [Pelagicoccus sp. SDUM812003]|uniref:YciI family protein n=1 Tax=Pelagicoccus sp. SDUM812003 TaxID=3041267 RepID=UPI00280C7BCE|nr:YciI family protein [Pelagicoccus sp. SDUM812003]MDQ8201394.1 YciI family protein [Pelagicoccus sp. SDUM812003]